MNNLINIQQQTIDAVKKAAMLAPFFSLAAH